MYLFSGSRPHYLHGARRGQGQDVRAGAVLGGRVLQRRSPEGSQKCKYGFFA